MKQQLLIYKENNFYYFKTLDENFDFDINFDENYLIDENSIIDLSGKLKFDINEQQSNGDILIKFNYGYLKFSFIDKEKFEHYDLYDYDIIDSSKINIELSMIKIQKHLRGKNFGRILMNLFLGFIKLKYPNSHIYLSALDIDNEDLKNTEKLVKFYQSFGFEVQTNYLEDKSDENDWKCYITMVKT